MESEGRILKKENVKDQSQCVYDENNNVTKIFVGGLPLDLTKEEFKSYFEKFGSIEDVVVMSDQETNRPRGFGFITFESSETANNVLKNRFYQLKNKHVEVKRAVAKERMSRNSASYYHTYNAMYNLNVVPFVGPTSYGNFGGFYGMNSYGYGYGYGYGSYNGVQPGIRCDGLSYLYYPYQNPNPCFSYANTSCYYADTYLYQRPNCYGKTSYSSSSKSSNKYRNRTLVVVKKNSNVKDGDDSDVVKKNESLLQKVDDLRPRDDNGVESVVTDVLTNGNGDNSAIKECLVSNCNGESDGGCVKAIEALSLNGNGDGSCKQMGTD